MEVEHHLQIPSAISDSLCSELTNTEESSSFEADDLSSSSPLTIENHEQFPQYQYHYQPQPSQHQTQFYQSPHHQNYQYQQFGFLPQQYSASSPYNGYYMPSPPVDFQQNIYNNYHYEPQQQQQQQQQQRTIVQTPSPNQENFSCSICSKHFKTGSNLNRHFMSKTHMKKLNSRKIQPLKQKKQKIGSVLTDLTDEEKRFLWKLDDEIWGFLDDYESEKVNVRVKNEILPTPPLSPPRQRKKSLKRLREKEEEEKLFKGIIEEVETLETIEMINVKEEIVEEIEV
ncbi:hypothetical protein PVAND_015999 [Polypedilum vanderplanki]|uniref:C2H2-type domain-containing protein n=1 Tax=Polypedilum vanderplanki TaxID=319348 RepID=A0A9J6BEB7_POLVA|nr:hypothetical protein PVAND_015999 [Polypedilum vanderplanki]